MRLALLFRALSEIERDLQGTQPAKGAMAVLAGLLLFGTPAQAEPMATGARLSLHPGFTRLTVDLTEPIAVNTFQLEMSQQVVVRMPAIAWHLPARVDNALGAITGFAAQSTGIDAWRLVIDVNRDVVLRRAAVAPSPDGVSWQLVVELADPDLPPREAVHPTIDQLVTGLNPYLPGWMNSPRVIVIDPGHGGRDPGASGISGALEKEIVLATAMALRDALESYGDYKVLMTRQDDSAVALEARSDFAAQVGADLFVSIHADAYHSSAARGASVYSLSSSASEQQAAAMSGDSGREALLADIGYGDQDGHVGNILLDMMMDVTTVDSASLAEHVVHELAETTRLLDNSHRLAAYHVLKVPHTPSILIELGYLSNALDATDLQSPEHQLRMAEAIARGIDRYMAEHPAMHAAVPGTAALLDSAATQTP